MKHVIDWDEYLLYHILSVELYGELSGTERVIEVSPEFVERYSALKEDLLLMRDNLSAIVVAQTGAHFS